MRKYLVTILSAAVLSGPAGAVEGGTGAYLLGARDIMAGYIPPAGTYLLNDFIYISGSAPALSISGVVVTRPEVEAAIYKLNATQVFDGEVFGGTLALNVNVPVVKAYLTSETTFGKSSFRVEDSELGMGDITISPMLGWHWGRLHTNASLSMYLPTGLYDTAAINPLKGEYDVLSIGKNKLAFDPTLSMTYLDAATGFEFSGAVGVTINTRNEATDYLTAPEFHVEVTSALHLPNGLALGVTGYVYQQLGDDSGSGAEQFKKAIGADSLQARVMGVGPVIQYNSEIGTLPVSVKAKYIEEFGAKRRLEGQMLWLTLGASF